MKSSWKMKVAGISLALLLAISGCSSNAVPATSPVKVDAPKQSQTQDNVPASVVAPSPAPATPPVATPAPTPTPSTPPVVAPSPIPKQTNQGVTVYVTKTGAKYHRDGCRYLSKTKIPISLSDAKSGYGPCSVCNPPQ